MRRLPLLVFAAVVGWASAARADCPFRHPVELAARGDGWLIPATWAHRGLNYGTPDMVALIQRAAKRVAAARGGGTLYVGDISRAEGGATEWHKSHKCGRDADLLFYAIGVDGKQAAAPSAMIAFDADGFGYADDGDKLRFDTARNWELVKALMQDRVAVERLFIHGSLERRLLAYARARKEPASLIERADALMAQPGAAGPHDDHLHVRIAGGGGGGGTVAKAKAGKRKPIAHKAKQRRRRHVEARSHDEVRRGAHKHRRKHHR